MEPLLMTETPDPNPCNLADHRLLSMRDVVALTTYSRPSIYRLVAAGHFPKPLKLGDVKIAFRESEVLAWLDSRRRALGP